MALPTRRSKVFSGAMESAILLVAAARRIEMDNRRKSETRVVAAKLIALGRPVQNHYSQRREGVLELEPRHFGRSRPRAVEPRVHLFRLSHLLELIDGCQE